MADLLRSGRAQLTPAELRVAQTLMADYPAAGLQPVAALAERAGVSGPTVVRLVAKLGFVGFADLQGRLRAELSARNSGPAPPYPEADGTDRAGSLLRRFERGITTAVRDSLLRTDTVEFDNAVELLSDVERPVGVTGGRVSAAHAHYLAHSLALLRPDVRIIAGERALRAAYLLDIQPETVVVIFDFRRYDNEMIEFGRGAAATGASVILMTDTYLSPCASAATVLLTSSVDGPAPFITLTPALALVEALVLGTIERGGLPHRGRRERYDALNADLSAAT